MSEALLAAALGLATWLLLVAILGRVPSPLEALARRRRARLVSEQFPAFLDRLSGSLKAGMGLERALAETAHRTPEPLKSELGHILQELQIGRTLPEAATAWALRLGSADARLVASAVQLSQESGGSLAEALERIAETVRQRHNLQGRLRALTAQGRMQAAVVGMMPVGLALFLWAWDPALVRSFARSSAGQFALLVALCLEAIGVLWIARIVRVSD